jgi:hypothetical protein
MLCGAGYEDETKKTLECLLLALKRTSKFKNVTSAFDPKRT